MSRTTRLASMLLGGVLVSALLVGCDVPLPGLGDPDPATPTGTSTAEMPTEISTILTECTEYTKGFQTAPGDLSGWAVVGPDGYHASNQGVHFAAIEGAFVQSYFNSDATDWPNQVGLNYFPQLDRGPVTNDCLQLDPELVAERIRTQASEGGAQIVSGPTPTEVAGMPAWVARFEYPSIDVSNDNYFVYGTHELIHIECQWGVGYADDVADACVFFLDNLSLG